MKRLVLWENAKRTGPRSTARFWVCRGRVNYLEKPAMSYLVLVSALALVSVLVSVLALVASFTSTVDAVIL